MHTFQKMKQFKENNTSKGRPRICVSLMGEAIEDIRIKAQKIKDTSADIIELRADYYNGDIVKDLSAVFLALRESFDGEVIFTYRSDENGEYGKLTPDTVRQLLMDAAMHNINYVDVEYGLFKEYPDIVEEIKKNAAVILSEHVYNGIYSADFIYNRLKELSECGADMVKYVIMPDTKHDVMQLMEGVIRYKEDYPERHIIAHAMGEIGLISRLSAEMMGSEIAFAALGQESAPGQIDVDMMKTCLDTIHEQLES